MPRTPRRVKLPLYAVFALVAALLTASVIDLGRGEPDPDAPSGDPGAVPIVRDDTRILQAARDRRVTLTIFLDFESGGSRALVPLIEALRNRYADRVTFAVRYYPLSGNYNGQLAAQAAEAAATQDRFEAMYRLLFETQRRWGGVRTSRERTFLGFARRLGLDIDRFGADLNAPATVARVIEDREDGVALGVHAAPTLFLGDEQLELSTAEQLEADLDAALAR